ncbi:hypothetical protein TorRG33x02_280850 [Trema orientale]|uniref:Uncharacterized protein n=1 Tax=Trema orientale TaxID=63057 RepID=A0A2P5CLD5_TREOI|nr:hypothetical protein TorRG33x02_280850 [Trema orientale]
MNKQPENTELKIDVQQRNIEFGEINRNVIKFGEVTRFESPCRSSKMEDNEKLDDLNEDFENAFGKNKFGDIMSSINVQTRSMLESESRFKNVSDVTVVGTREVGGSSLIPRGRTKALGWSRALDLVLIDVKDEILMDEQNKEYLDADIMNDSSAEEHLTLFAEVS